MIKLTPLQQRHMGSIKWLLGDSRADGKTMLLALAYLDKGVENLGSTIEVRDHSPSRGSNEYLLGMIRSLYQEHLDFEVYDVTFKVLDNSFKVTKAEPHKLHDWEEWL